MAAQEYRRVVVSVRGVRHQAKTCRARSFGRISLDGELAKRMTLAVRTDCRDPLPGAFVPGDATVLRGRAPRARHVLLIPVFRDRSQVAPDAVQPVAVNVIAIEAVALDQSKQLTVQKLTDWLPVDPFRPPSIACHQTPPILARPLTAGGVNRDVRPDGPIPCVQRKAYGSVANDDQIIGRTSSKSVTACARAAYGLCSLWQPPAAGGRARNPRLLSQNERTRLAARTGAVSADKGAAVHARILLGHRSHPFGVLGPDTVPSGVGVSLRPNFTIVAPMPR
jgi:hypothetical protein